MPTTAPAPRQGAQTAEKPRHNYVLDACGYARVSTEEQARNSHALDNQIQRIRELIGPNAPLFVDKASRTSRHRPQYEEMKRRIERGEFRVVVVLRPDRLGHSKAEGCARVYEWLHRKPSVVTKFIDFDLDLTTAAGRLLLKQLISVSEFELHMLSLRIRKNKEVSMKKGEATSHPPFGYARVDRTFVPDHFMRHCFLWQKPERKGEVVDGYSNADLARMMLLAVARTGSYTDAIREMRRFSLTPVQPRRSLARYATDEEGVFRQVWPVFPPAVSTVRRWTFHPAYRGHLFIRRNWDVSRLPGDDAQNKGQITGSRDEYMFRHENRHEPLISEQVYQQLLGVERRHAQAGAAPAAANRRADPFCGLLCCGDCGRKLKYNAVRSRGKGTEEKVYSYYKCPNPQCSGLGLRVATPKLMGMLARRLARIARAVQDGQRPLPEVDLGDQQRIEDIDDLVAKMRKMNDPYFDESISHLLAERRELANEPDDDAAGLCGNGWQMLQQPKARNDADWFVFLSRPDLNLHSFVRRIVVGYEKAEDRPKRAPSRQGGRRSAAQAGNPAILDVEPL